MNIDNIKRIELEVTSDCNAACPGCNRTINIDKVEVLSFTLEDLQRMFPDRRHIENKKFKFCGYLGDVIVNKDAIKMTEYLIYNGANCQWSTNGGYQTADWWEQLGKLSKETKKLDISFCVDGHKETNHIYRVNTKWAVLERNMKAYSDAGGIATRIYKVFDHNEHEQEAARLHAKELGFKFATRTGMRNSYNSWIAKLGKKNSQKEKVITTTGAKQHSKLKQIQQLDKFLGDANKTLEQTTEIVNSMTCKLIHEGEIFISSKQEMWPCCFLWDSTFKNYENINEKLSEYSTGWNSLKTNSISDVLSHPWFDKILVDSWWPSHDKHLTRCVRTCAYNHAYHNEIKVEA